MTQTPAHIAATYFEAWKAKDFDTLASILHEDATFRGPLGTADSGEECVAGLKGMSQIVTDIDIAHVFVDGPNVLTWFELHTSIRAPSSRRDSRTPAGTQCDIWWPFRGSMSR